MALRGRRINNFLELWCLLASRGLDIGVSAISFQKSNISWPQQPPTESISDIIEKLDFWWSIPQKKGKYWSFWYQGWSIHWDLEVLWWNKAVEVGEANEVAEADEVKEAAEVLRPGKSPLKTLKSCKFLNSALVWCFENKKFWVESWNIKLNFSTFSVRGSWGQPTLLF